MDATLHAFLNQRSGGHASVCAALGARGLGLMESRLTFLAPAGDGDRLTYRIERIAWEAHSFTLTYAASAGGRPLLEGLERRGVFVMDGARMKAADTSRLRDAVEHDVATP